MDSNDNDTGHRKTSYAGMGISIGAALGMILGKLLFTQLNTSNASIFRVAVFVGAEKGQQGCGCHGLVRGGRRLVRSLRNIGYF